jgi:hypothetical protein
MAGYNWNFKTDHVEQGYKGGQFASAESTLIAAGPPRSEIWWSTNGLSDWAS